MRYPCFCATQRQFFGHGSSASLIATRFFGSWGSGMGPAHCPCKVDIQLPTPPITAYNSFILRESCLIHAMRMPYSSLNQYHPGTFGGSFVHVSARGRAFHAATAASLVVLMGPLNAHFTCWHMTNAQPVPFALAIPAGCPHAGHGNGSNVSSSGMIPPHS